MNLDKAKELHKQLGEWIAKMEAKPTKETDFWEDIFPDVKTRIDDSGNYQIENFGQVVFPKFKPSFLEEKFQEKRKILLLVAQKLNGCSQDDLDLLYSFNEYYHIVYLPHSGRIEINRSTEQRHWGVIHFKNLQIAEQAIQLCEDKFGKDFFKP